MEKEKSGEIACVTYWRGLAAVGVALPHVKLDLWVGWSFLRANPGSGTLFDRIAAWLSLPTIFMTSCVMLFFVISGFCIHHPYAGADGRGLEMREYLVRRFLRIYPPYLAAVLFTIGVQMVTLHGQGMDWTINLASVVMAQNFLGMQPQFNNALWTIPVEFEFYLVFPLIHFLVRRSWQTVLALALVVSAAAIVANLWTGEILKMSFLPYWVTWAFGAVIAERFKRGELRQPGSGVIAGALAMFALGIYCAAIIFGGEPEKWGNNILHLVGALGFGAAYGVLIWWSLVNRHLFDRIPGAIAKALLGLGAISYSLYLFHMPFFHLCGVAWQAAFGGRSLNYFVTFPFILLAILLASVVYMFIEKPSHNLARRVSRRLASRVRAAGASGAVEVSR